MPPRATAKAMWSLSLLCWMNLKADLAGATLDAADTCTFKNALQGKKCEGLDEVVGPFDEESCRQTCCDVGMSLQPCDVWNWNGKQCFHGGQGSYVCKPAEGYIGEIGLLPSADILGDDCGESGVCPTSRIKVQNCEWMQLADGRRDLQCPDRVLAGYLEETVQSLPGYNWWFDPGLPHAMHFFDLDTLYDTLYHGEDHVNEGVVANYSKSALEYCRQLLGRDCKTVVDVGAGCCYFSEGMRRLGASVMSVEGTAAGYAACVHRAGASSIVRHDLRLPLSLNTKFDLATCSEVAEHIEPPFAGTLVHTLTQHADVVWFSSEEPRWVFGNADHVHHSNEQPDLFWDRLFAFFGFQAIVLPAEVVDAVDKRGRRVYYRSSAVPVDRRPKSSDSS